MGFLNASTGVGRVSGDGVILPLALTHRMLGQIVGARRPTVSSALSELAARGELARRPDGSWLLSGNPPDSEALAPRTASSAHLPEHDPKRPAPGFVPVSGRFAKREPTAENTAPTHHARAGRAA
jgi:hypothetical protein